MNSVSHTATTRLLHVALMASVLWQLIGSNFVERPRNAQPGNTFYVIHEFVGLATLALVLLFWLWTMVRHRETPFAALFPWFSPARLRAVAADFGAHWTLLRQWRLPAVDSETPLASAVHGLGLLVVLTMGLSGAWLYAQGVPGGWVLSVHKALSNLMWAYVVGHAGLALVHQWLGHRVLQRMFTSAARQDTKS